MTNRGAGFSLRLLGLARTNLCRLKPAPQLIHQDLRKIQ